jgi:DNA-binding NtrC family response regulator
MTSNLFPTPPVLLVDDEEQFLRSLNFALSADGINHLVECRDSRKVESLLAGREFGLVLLDMSMPHLSGRELLPRIVRDYPDIPVIVVTALNEVETAVQCMQTGAFDYLVKPVDDIRLLACVRRAINLLEVRRENRLLKDYLLNDRLENPDAFAAIVTRNKGMRAVFQYVEAISRTILPVLITGETGTGKELIARAIHNLSGRKGEFVPVNVAGVDDHFFSDTLFGHKKGAFTGADRDRKGLLEQASGGTLFLDEIGDLSADSQVKLLRLIEERKYYPVGADMPRLADARIVAATHRDLENGRAEGSFRKDLFYRLRTHHLRLPPLRERKEDIPLLAEYFLDRAAQSLGRKKITPPRELFVLLPAYHFPGNVRELEGMIYDAVSRHKSGVLSLESFREKIAPRPQDGQEVSPSGPESLRPGEEIVFPGRLPALKESERLLIAEALKRSAGNQTLAAQMLGLTRRALNNRLKRTRK